ncbi:MAG: NAD+ synthase (glutamine-hydrolysing) [bacterium P3]|nr:MAG: NAD+ synthase (glutamine-hydrolysing) [bacterium P3]KWW42678.1 MAG: NAD+ synthase (glutamine-hydrolysing) [bacterium F083]
MNVHIVQHDILTAQPEANLQWILDELNQPASRDALLTVFPACTLCGYPLHAAAAYTDLQKRAQSALQELVQHSEHRAFLVGLPLQIQDKGLCNAVVFVQNNAIRGIVTKKYLAPDEQKYFVRGDGVQFIQFQNQQIAIGFYEDLKELAKSHAVQPDMVVCCGCNTFDYNKPYRIRYRMTKIVENLNASLVFVNRVGGEGPLLYAGGSMALNAAGGILSQFPYFEATSATVDLQVINAVDDPKPEAVELVHRALVTGLRDYFSKNGLSRAVLGLSGGVDSALVCTLAVDALGAENVHGILMPSQYSTDHSVTDAETLARNLGIQYDIVPIKPLFDTLRATMQPLFGSRAEDVTEENMQARLRGVIVMSYANKFGALALNTTNKSEAAMGYGTLYGDSCGAVSVIGDLYKTEVYELCNYINREGERIPQHTIDKAPSAELRPGQKDSDSLPDYALLDAILNLHIEEQLCADEIVAEGYDADLVAGVLRKVAANEWKRLQFAPLLKVSPMSFTIDRRWPVS